ncbi:MAG: hypothetical protein D6706_18150, partial [Chloroflexi bacterium]
MIQKLQACCFICCICIGLPLFLQAQGDSCVTAVQITTNGTYTADGPSTGNGCHNCSGGATNADWYYFIAPANGLIDIYSCNDPNNTDTRLWVYSGSCGALVPVDSSDDDCGLQSQIIGLSVTAGTTYYFEWDNRWSSSSFEFDFIFRTTTAANDVCGDAQMLQCNDVIVASTDSASTVDNPTIFCGVSLTAPGLWYRITGTGDIFTVSTCSPVTNYDTKIHVYTGSCSNPLCVAGVDDDGTCTASNLLSTVSFATIPGVDYYILVSGFQSNTGVFELSVTCETPVPNDSCINAFTIGCDTTITDSTTVATLDNAPSCTPAITAPGVWYHFAGTGDFITLSTCNQADFDTKISVWSGSCGNLTCVGGNDDGQGCSGFTSEFSFQSQAGVDYYILVHAFGTQTGVFSLTLSCSPACSPVPANDVCASAAPLVPGQTCVTDTFTNECASSATTASACDPFGNMQDVWFSLNTATMPNYTLVLNTISAGPLNLALWDSCGGNEIGCLTGLTSDSVFLIGLDSFTTYYIEIWNAGGANAGTFELCLLEGPPPPPNDQCSGADTITCGMTVSGSTSFATADFPPACAPGVTAAGVWYYFEGTGDLITVSTCNI